MGEEFALRVLLHGDDVGILRRLHTGNQQFSFTDRYIENANRSTLGIGFRHKLGGLPKDYRTAHSRLFPWFSNLLPEGTMLQYLSHRAGIRMDREFFLLWLLGRDLPGAVEFRPMEEGAWPPTSVFNSEELEVRAREAAFRFSLSGVQPKFSGVLDEGGRARVHRYGIGGDWVIKLPSTEYELLPENEFAMMSLARMIGLDVPDVRLVHTDRIEGIPEDFDTPSAQALLVRRFDRAEAEPVHIEDFAQVFGVHAHEKYGGGFSYRQILETLWKEVGENAVTEFTRSLVFNALIGNGDMHLKNWSVIYRDRVRPTLAPGYDFVSTVAFLPTDRTMALKFGRSRKWTDFSVEALRRMADKVGLAQSVLLDPAHEAVEQFKTVWSSEKGHLPLTSGMVEAVEMQLRRSPLSRQDD